MTNSAGIKHGTDLHVTHMGRKIESSSFQHSLSSSLISSLSSSPVLLIIIITIIIFIMIIVSHIDQTK